MAASAEGVSPMGPRPSCALELDGRGPPTLHEQICRLLREAILGGALEPGALLPAETTLAS